MVSRLSIIGIVLIFTKQASLVLFAKILSSTLLVQKGDTHFWSTHLLLPILSYPNSSIVTKSYIKLRSFVELRAILVFQTWCINFETVQTYIIYRNLCTIIVQTSSSIHVQFLLSTILVSLHKHSIIILTASRRYFSTVWNWLMEFGEYSTFSESQDQHPSGASTFTIIIWYFSFTWNTFLSISNWHIFYSHRLSTDSCYNYLLPP